MRLLKLAALAAVCAFGAFALAAGTAGAETPEKTKITLGVGGKPLFYYLPLTIAERKGFFKDAGLDVDINDFGGGAKSLQALVGGSVDVVTGAYEHTIRMQLKGQDIRAVIELGRYPGMVLAVRKELAGKVKSPGDLKGMKIGVTAPGSSTNFFAEFLLAKNGLKPEDASYIGVGGGATAAVAIKQGQIDAISHLDPIISKLEADGDVFLLADTRTTAGTTALFGGSNPAGVVYLKEDFIQKYPITTQAIVDAFYKSLLWLAKASPEDIAATVPEEFYLGDKPLYIRAAKASLDMYSRTGVISPEGMRSALGMLQAFDPELAAANDATLAKTFDDRFVKKAAATIK